MKKLITIVAAVALMLPGSANADNNDIFEYPRAERLVTEDGQHFYDS